MNRYSKTSQKRLDECHSELQMLFGVVLRLYDHSIYCGHRTKEDQEKAVADKASEVLWPMSKHNQTPSMAVDAGPYFADVDRWDENQCRHFGGFVMGIASLMYERGEMRHKVRWGGDWDQDNNITDQTFNDLVHFELIEVGS